MNKLLQTLSILFFSISLAFSSENDLKERDPCDPRCNLFRQGEKFPLLEEDVVSLIVSSSGPIYYENMKFIDLDNSSNSDQEPVLLLKNLLLKKNRTFFDIIFDGGCVGKVKTYITRNDPQDVYIQNIEVNEQYRKKSIGTKAIGLVVKFYLQKQFRIHRFFAQIKPENDASIKIFTKNDFSNDGSFLLGLLEYVRKVEG